MPVAKKLDTNAAPPPSTEFTGWYRPHGGGQWQSLVTPGTYDEARQGLYREMDKGRSGDWFVLPIGRRP